MGVLLDMFDPSVIVAVLDGAAKLASVLLTILTIWRLIVDFHLKKILETGCVSVGYGT